MERPATALIDEPDKTTAVNHSSQPWRRSRRFWTAILLVCLLVIVLWRISDGAAPPLTQTDVDRAVQSGIEKAREEDLNTPPDAATAYRRIRPSLVTVVTTGAAANVGAPAVTGKSSLGAGVIINARGDILTALHVIEDGAKVHVRFADGTQANAKVLKRQPEIDIAVLGVDRLPEVTVPAVLGGGAQIGDAVFPVGNPLGLQGTLTAGVVSALNRSIRSENGRTLRQLIQFDAAVNPGNSGGPLLDRTGHVIGIVTALANPSGQSYFVGIGFAVPIATAGGAAGGPSK